MYFSFKDLLLCWGCDCYPHVRLLFGSGAILPIPQWLRRWKCLLLCWSLWLQVPLLQCDLTLWWLAYCLLVRRDKIPVVTDWATVLIWMWQKHILSPHWNFCSERPGRASVCPPLQSIKRSLNVNFCCFYFNAFHSQNQASIWCKQHKFGS